MPGMKTNRKTRRGKPEPAVLAEVVRQIVEAARPEKIVLFGLAARGTMGPDSDIDLLVIKGGRFSHDRYHASNLSTFVRPGGCRCRGCYSRRS